MSAEKMTKIDSEKLKEELIKRGISYAALSVKLKKAESYISKCIQRGSMSSSDYDLMCLRLGVDEDYFLIPEPKLVKEMPDMSDCTTVIPYEELERLIACKYAVDTMLENAQLSTGYDGALFIDYRVVFGILKAYAPKETENRLNKLREEERNG